MVVVVVVVVVAAAAAPPPPPVDGYWPTETEVLEKNPVSVPL